MGMTVDEALQMLKEKRGSHRYSCYVPSLEKECIFKPVTVAELKSLSKIALDENDESFLMAATALILNLCTEELHPNQLTEIDRIKLILDIKKNNQMADDVYNITCRKCSEIYSVQLNIDNMIEKLTNAPKSKIVQLEEDNIHFWIELNLPSIDLLCKFKKYIENTNKEIELKNSDLSNPIFVSDEDRLKMEIYFINYMPMLFIKSLKINDNTINDFDKLSINERDNFLNEFPATFFDKLSNVVTNEKEFQLGPRLRNETKCPNCGEENNYDPEVKDFFLI